MARAGAALLALLLAVWAAGCGEDDGVAEGATVRVYMEAPRCGESARVAAAQNESGDGIAVKFVCLPAARGPELSQGVGGGRQVDLARAGANARRATEDSTAIAYIETDDPGVGRFTHPILEAAGIGWISTPTPRQAIQRLWRLIFEADVNSLRADVREGLGQG